MFNTTIKIIINVCQTLKLLTINFSFFVEFYLKDFPVKNLTIGIEFFIDQIKIHRNLVQQQFVQVKHITRLKTRDDCTD